MNKQQGLGVLDRLIYGVVMVLAMKLVAAGYIESTDAQYLALGVVMAVGSVVDFWRNRPSRLLDRAAAVLPQNTQVIVEATPHASPVERKQVEEITEAASDKVQAKV